MFYKCSDDDGDELEVVGDDIVVVMLVIVDKTVKVVMVR